mgnify:CR=1 FL=1
MNAGKPSASGAQLRIGTRRSPLALVQSENVRAALAALHPGLEIEIETIRTSGDRFIDRDLSAIGGKGLFTKEIEEALIAGRVDIAVHSMKDVPTWLPEGLGIFCLLEREDPRDVFISPVASGFADLVVEAKLRPFDYCALVPVVEGAGGVITDWEGRPLNLASDGRVIAAGDRRTHGECLKVLRL